MKKFFLALLVLVLVILGFVYFKDEKVIEPELGTKCYDSQKYFVIEKSLSDTVGSNILIKYKKSRAESIPCSYSVKEGDWELNNLEASYFLTLTDNFLVLDVGTAPPPRGILVYNLNTRKEVFRDMYTKPVEVSGDKITYLSVSKDIVTSINCPMLDEYKSNGLGATILSKVTVDLATLVKTDLGQKECIAVQ